MKFKAGDTVTHGPSGETWVLACDETPNGDILPAGWPETLARSGDCELVESATDEQRIDMLRMSQGGDGYRGSVARHQLRAADPAAPAEAKEPRP